ncbi:Complex I-15 kDa [Aphelenchoides bicaudatus]|nr:Complex I-15 kDa [Aphelenchoides bicaudatus]
MDSIQPESRRGLTPLVKAPFVDRISFPSAQQHTICAWFESQFYRCLEAYGTRLGRIYCDLEHRDLTECTTGDKQYKRARAIRQQRAKLYREGKIEEKLIEDYPKPGVFKPDHFSNNRIY